MSHRSREANLLGACSLAVAGRLPAAADEAALVALRGWLGGTTVDGLARVLSLTHSGAVRLVDRLERDGWVERRLPIGDLRKRELWVTAAGAREAQRLQAGRFAALEDVLATLSAAEREALTPLLERLLAAMTPDHAAAGRICRLCDPDVCGHPERCPVTIAARA